MVVPDHMPIKLSVEGRSRKYLVALDGKSMSISQGEEVEVHKADFMINVIKFEDNNFLDTIRNKMYWGVDKRNWSITAGNLISHTRWNPYFSNLKDK